MSLATDDGYGVSHAVPSLTVPVDRARFGERVRSGGLDEDHISLLMETVDQWPPIVVWGDEALVLDGAHRVEAARRLGRRSVLAERFVGTREEAFVESVRRNVNHGLPLSVSDRRAAALRLLAGHAVWSDRRIALLCGLSGKTVARLRRQQIKAGPRDNVAGIERRIGRDGKIRPVQTREMRDRIRNALEENPSGSLRVIAAAAGASPETVRRVRAGLNDGGDARPKTTSSQSHRSERKERRNGVEMMPSNVSMLVTGLAAGHSVKLPRWASDPALLTCGDGGAFARWFASNRVADEWHDYVWRVPLGRIYEVVDEARRRASSWNAFASALERRTH